MPAAIILLKAKASQDSCHHLHTTNWFKLYIQYLLQN